MLSAAASVSQVRAGLRVRLDRGQGKPGCGWRRECTKPQGSLRQLEYGRPCPSCEDSGGGEAVPPGILLGLCLGTPTFSNTPRHTGPNPRGCSCTGRSPL